MKLKQIAMGFLLAGLLLVQPISYAGVKGQDVYKEEIDDSWEVYIEIDRHGEEEVVKSDEEAFGVGKRYKDFGYDRCIKGAVIGSYRGKKKNLTIPSKIKGMKVVGVSGLYSASKLESIHIPATVTEELYLNGIDSLKKITIDKRNPKFKVKNGIIVNKEETVLYSVPSRLTEIEIPNTIKEIYYNAFAGSNVKEIVLPESVETMDWEVISDCPQLEKLVINSKFRVLNSIVGDCPALKTVILPETVEIIESGEFDRCAKLEDIYIYNKECSIKNEFESFSPTIPKTATIHGYAGSTAELYAIENGQKFVVLPDVPPVEKLTREAKAGEVVVDAIHFPDKRIRKYIKNNFDTDKDLILSATELANGKNMEIDCEKEEVNLEGISYLTGMRELTLKEAQIISGEEQIASLKELEALDISSEDRYPSGYTLISKLSLKQNVKLKKLILNYVDLSKLDVSANTALEELSICNEIRKLDLSANKKLKKLRCVSSSLKKLSLDAQKSALEVLDISAPVKTLDVSGLTALKELDCSGSGLKELKLGSIGLEVLNCNYNDLTKLDVRKNKKLKSLDCGSNKIKKLDVSKNTKLETLLCNYSGIHALDISKNKKLKCLDCGSNDLMELNVSKCPKLEELDVTYNNIKTLGIGKNKKLKVLKCSNNKLAKLDVRKHTRLQILECNGNAIKKLDVSKNKRLTELNCSENGIKTLQVSRNRKLTSLSCCENQLKKLSISKNTRLQYVSCYGNEIKKLRIKGLNKMERVSMDKGVKLVQ